MGRLRDFVDPIFSIGLVLALAGIGFGVILVNGAIVGIAILVLLGMTVGGTIAVVYLLSAAVPNAGAGVLFMFWWLPFLGGCWLGAIGRWVWLGQ